MKIIKKIFFSLLSLFLLFFSFTSLKQILAFGPEQLGLKSSLYLGFMINLCVTGIFAFPGFVFSTSKALPENYYIIKRPSKLIHWYNVLGVKYFRKLLIIFFWGKKDHRKKFFDGTKSGLKQFIYQSKQSEFGHLGALVLLLIINLLFLIPGYNLLVLFTFLINIIGNFYPVILQRYHRIRIQRILAKPKLEESNNSKSFNT